LHDYLENLGPEIEFGTEVMPIEDDPTGLRVTRDTGGRTEVITAAYEVGRHSFMVTLEPSRRKSECRCRT
jgi:hypothetical protein